MNISLHTIRLLTLFIVVVYELPVLFGLVHWAEFIGFVVPIITFVAALHVLAWGDKL